MELLFATSNQHKVMESAKIAAEYGITLKQVHVPYAEVRAENVAKIAEEGVKYVFGKVRQPVIVEDSGLFIQAIGGFPGPYSAYVFGKIGCEGISRLMEGVVDRSARFVSAIGYADKRGVKVFEGTVEGRITLKSVGQGGFGYDPVFQPIGYGKTFAQDASMKDEVSHRRRSTEQLCRFLQSRQSTQQVRRQLE